MAVSDLVSHANTEEKLKLNKNVWREGHYTPKGNLILRFGNNDIKPDNYEENFKSRFPSFNNFFNWCLMETKQEKKYNGSLNVSGCDLKGIKLPETIGGSLDVSGCDLKGIKLPENMRIIE